MKDAEKRDNKLTAEMNSNVESIKVEKKRIQQLRVDISGDEKLLAGKEKDLEKFGGLFKNLKDKDESDRAALLAAQEQFQKVSAGLLHSDSGENATLEQQVISAKQIAAQAQTEVKQCEMGMKHVQEQLAVKQRELQNTQNDGRDDTKNLEKKEKELKTLENDLNKLNYTDGSLQEIQNQKRELTREIKNLQEQVDQFESRYPKLRFEYRDPEPGFRRDSVKGLVCKLITLKDQSTAYALDVAAGAKVLMNTSDNF